MSKAALQRIIQQQQKDKIELVAQRDRARDAERSNNAANHAAQIELGLAAKKIDELQMRVDGLLGSKATLDGELREKSSEIRNVKNSNRALVDTLQNKLKRSEDAWYKAIERNRALEKLLVHNGKAIGALSDLAAEKYKNDELPF